MSFRYLILRPDARSHPLPFTSRTLTFVKDLSFIFWATYPPSVPNLFAIAIPATKNKLHSNLTKWFIDSNKKNRKDEISRVADSSSKRVLLSISKFPFLIKIILPDPKGNDSSISSNLFLLPLGLGQTKIN
ncbi:hypothetical protein SAMN04488097_3234 [Epilithonimonas lactis]|uniref:Uncharacterized protein n=1 Tax=Epilithonimonas lactis TaxID=421072 RepID=A0A085BJS0_9FLAO|nr:hypothetical protein IO89_06585 [Epilithonimonas lactis]SEQ85284.1 hypothetical protein SAMN04488097_3234 [Epilithonimonas lactis]